MSPRNIVEVAIFLIIIIVQFIVSRAPSAFEVAARFTPTLCRGKQMSIDADLNPAYKRNCRRGKDAENPARGGFLRRDGRREQIKGDAIVAIIITVINCVGGIIIGMVSEAWR